MKFHFIIFATTLALLFSHPFSVSAQTPTEPANEASDDAVIQENLRQRLKKVIDEKQDQIKGVMNSVGKKRGLIGVVERVSEETLNIKTKQGNLIVSFTDEVSIIQNNKPLKKADIEIENHVIVLGLQQQTDFTPTHLYVSKTSLLPTPRTIVVGNVMEIDRKTITIKPRTSDERRYSLDTKTELLNDQNEKLAVTDIEDGQDVLLIVTSAETTSAPQTTTQPTSGKVVVLRSLAASKANGNNE